MHLTICRSLVLLYFFITFTDARVIPRAMTRQIAAWNRCLRKGNIASTSLQSLHPNAEDIPDKVSKLHHGENLQRSSALITPDQTR